MQMYLLLNNACNLNCGFCIRGKSDENKFLQIESLKAVLKENDFRKYHLLITGGEPSLHKNLPEIIDLCSSHFKGISINTNGVESDWINEVASTDFHVQLSLDGTAEYHNTIRGNGRVDIYSRILEAIEKLNSRGITYNISTTVGKSNYENVKLLCRQMEKLPGLKYWKVSPQLPFGCASREESLDTERWNELVDYLIQHSAVLLRISKLFDFPLLDRYMSENVEAKAFLKANCGNVKYKVYVYPDFTVYPCTCLTDFPLGNLLENSLKEIISTEQSKKFAEYTVKSTSACADCKYLPICNGGCIGMSYHFFGEIGMGDYRCPLIKK